MMFSVLFLLSATLLSGCAADWHQVWSEEFNGSGSPSDAEWWYQTGGGGWGNNELEFYTQKHTNNARVENGHLVIQARVEEQGGRHFTSARMDSHKGWTYGKFEARAKLPKGKHLWPAIWM
ncbi:unnamed protein product, partial [Medioppia subpectinata]